MDTPQLSPCPVSDRLRGARSSLGGPEICEERPYSWSSDAWPSSNPGPLPEPVSWGSSHGCFCVLERERERVRERERRGFTATQITEARLTNMAFRSVCPLERGVKGNSPLTGLKVWSMGCILFEVAGARFSLLALLDVLSRFSVCACHQQFPPAPVGLVLWTMKWMVPSANSIT